MTRKHMAAIQQREAELLKRLETVRNVKIATLEKQSSDFTNCQLKLKQVVDNLERSLNSGVSDVDLIKATDTLTKTLAEAHVVTGSHAIHEDDAIEFVTPSAEILKSLNTLSYVGGSGFAPACRAEGDGLKKAILGKDARFFILVKDQLQEQRSQGGDNIRVTIISPDGRNARLNLFDRQNGTYQVIWKPSMEGEHHLTITLKDCHIHGSPFKVHARSGRQYQRIETPIRVFGMEGDQDGQLCRPWGICCSRDGMILVANR